jgi:hypothetical protein
MILLLLLARLPRRPRYLSGVATSVIGLAMAVAGLVLASGLAIDGAIVLLCGLLVLYSLRVDPDRVRARLAALRGR